MANLPFGLSRTGLLGSTAQVGQSLRGVSQHGSPTATHPGGPSLGHFTQV